MVNEELMRNHLHNQMLPACNSPPVEWVVADGLVAYPDAVAEMDRLAAAIADRL